MVATGAFLLLGLMIGGILPRLALYLLQGSPQAYFLCTPCLVAEGQLGGKCFTYPPSCSRCGKRLSPAGIVISIVAGLGYGVAFIVIGWESELLVALVLISLLLVAWIMDGWCRLILDRLTMSGSILLFVVRLFIHDQGWISYLLGFFAGGALLLFIAWISRGGMGGGDIKLLAMAGIALGFPDVLLAFGLAVFSGGIWILVLLTAGKIGHKEAIPFGSHLGMGIFVAFLWSEPLVRWYLSTFLL